MYAVIKTGGKQYRVRKGETLKLEKLDADEGAAIEFSEVLLVGEGTAMNVGAPLVTGAKVKGKVVAQGRDPKVEIIKFKRRANYRRTRGHRQSYTMVEITGISGGPSKRSAAKEAAPAEE